MQMPANASFLYIKCPLYGPVNIMYRFKCCAEKSITAIVKGKFNLISVKTSEEISRVKVDFACHKA